VDKTQEILSTLLQEITSGTPKDCAFFSHV